MQASEAFEESEVGCMRVVLREVEEEGEGMRRNDKRNAWVQKRRVTTGEDLSEQDYAYLNMTTRRGRRESSKRVDDVRREANDSDVLEIEVDE